MTKLFLILFAVFASTILLTQVVGSADARYSEAREKAKNREKQLVDAQEKMIKDKKKKALEEEKKGLDPKTVTTKTKEPKNKASTDAKNAARLQALKDAKAKYDAANVVLEAAKKAYKVDQTNPTKKQQYLDAKKALEQARIDRELAKLG